MSYLFFLLCNGADAESFCCYWAEDIGALILRGFDAIGALIAGIFDLEKNCSWGYWRCSSIEKTSLWAVADLDNSHVQLFVSTSGNSTSIVSPASVVYEDHPEEYVWREVVWFVISFRSMCNFVFHRQSTWWVSGPV